MPQEHRLPVGDLHQSRVRGLLFDDRPRLDEAEGASHDDREECVGAAVRLDDAVVEILQADIAALALVLERGVMHVRERHGEIVRHAFRHAALSDLIGDAVEDDELAVEPFAGSDAGVAWVSSSPMVVVPSSSPGTSSASVPCWYSWLA